MKNCLLKAVVMLFILIVFQDVNSQTQFVNISNSISSLPTLSNDNIECEWGDFDNDNDLDFILYGYSEYSYPEYCKIYQNIGNDSFIVQNSIQLPALSYCSWGDFDNDGDIDLLTSIKDTFAVFKNTLPDSIGFIRLTDSCYAISSFGTQGWLNLFNTGKLDLLTYFSPALGYMTIEMSKNNEISSCGFISKDSFTASGYAIGGIPHLIDINNDGYIDLHNLGSINYVSGSLNSIINNGLDSLIKFRMISNGHNYNNKIESIFGDLNNDGYIDDGVSKKVSNYNYSNKLYKNNHNNTYTEQTNTGIPSNLNTLQYFFDYNNDGKLDVLINKANGKNTIYKSNGSFSFSEDLTINNLNYYYKESAAADYDNDGDLDLFLSGTLASYPGNFTALYRNDSTPPNTPPTQPNGLYAEMDSTKLILRWQRATDVETPQATLSYNLMVGTSPKGIDITSPMADTVTGFRRVVELGNAQLNDFYILDKSIFNIGDTVYWSVQTIDNGFGYSPFSQQCTTIICNSLKPQFDTICNNDSLLWQGNFYNTTGNYYQSYGSGASCDSSFNLFLKADSAYLNLQQADICNGSGGYQWQGNTYYGSGTYNIYNTTTQGCDSIDRLILGVHHSFTNLQNEHICMGDSLAFGSNYLKSPGVYNDSLLSAFGCDSLVQLTLDISPEDTLVIQMGDSLIAQSTTGLFRWWDCQAQNYIYAANNAVFVPYQNGSYAVEITENGCSYLTECFDVTGLGFNTASKGDFIIQPNPATDWLIISSSNLIIEKVNIITIQGKQLISKQNLNGNKSLKLNISSLAPGVYLLQFTTEYGMEYRRLIKE